MPSTKLTAAVALLGSIAIANQTRQCAAFVPTVTPRFPGTSTSSTTQLNAKGRKSKDLADIASSPKKEGGVGAKGVKGLSGEATPAAAAPSANWVPVAGLKEMSDLPKEENKVRSHNTHHFCLFLDAVVQLVVV